MNELPASSRYEVLVKIASGGMGTVYVGRSRGAFGRLFAIKRAHPHLRDDAVFRRMFVSEARLASRLHHPNVVAVQDVEELEDELLLVMDYVDGVALSELEMGELDPHERLRIAVRMTLDACAGLAAAHDIRGDDGTRLGLVHRDVSPHNVLVGADGVTRLTDFGIAKGRALGGGATATGAVRGKLGYMPPEYVLTGNIDQRGDVWALGVVLWEALAADRFYLAENQVALIQEMQVSEPRPLASVPPEIADVVLSAVAKDPASRTPSARAFGDALERAARGLDAIATPAEVGALVERQAHDALTRRREAVRGAETATQKIEEIWSPPTRTVDIEPAASFEAALAETRSVVPTVAPEPPPEPPTRFALPLLASILLAILLVGVWLRLGRTPPEPAAPTYAPAIATPSPILPAPVLLPPEPQPAASPAESAPPPPSARAKSRPKPEAPSHAPPNPYKR
jgi:eukaryotic-like serine/threonine-protein kinase